MAGGLLRRLDTRAPGFEADFGRLARRRLDRAEEVDAAAARIVDDVRQRGDDAILDAIERFDGYRLTREDLAVPPEEIEKGAASLDPADRAALELAADRIRSYHAHRVPASWTREGAGERLGQMVRPLARVALYVPAFQAPLASSVLMLAVPARVAGVPELVLATPGRDIHPAVLAAAQLAGVTAVFRIGGAQAVAALAYGTETVPAVDKIVGPGNAYTQAAKRRVFGAVAIDAEAGPSEVLIVADDAADPELVAADLLAQAEHDEMAGVVLATPSEALLAASLEELERQLPALGRARVIRESLSARSAAIRTRDLEEAVALGNRYAPEHLQLLVAEPERWLDRVENAGAVFLGAWSPVPAGDYVAGPSHVLPTGGTARFFSVLGVEDFLRRASVIELSRDALRRVGPEIVRLAELEGLGAHAAAVRRRLERD